METTRFLPPVQDLQILAQYRQRSSANLAALREEVLIPSNPIRRHLQHLGIGGGMRLFVG